MKKGITLIDIMMILVMASILLVLAVFKVADDHPHILKRCKLFCVTPKKVCIRGSSEGQR